MKTLICPVCKIKLTKIDYNNPKLKIKHICPKCGYDYEANKFIQKYFVPLLK
jgi:Zn-finger nucleic acid-binding protein